MNKLLKWLLHLDEFSDKCETYGGFEVEKNPIHYRKSRSYTDAKNYFINQRLIQYNYFLQVQQICPDNEVRGLLQALCDDNIISIGADGLIRCLLTDSRTLREKVSDELDYIDSLCDNGYKFERYVANLLLHIGFQSAYTTPKSNDYGADVIAVSNNRKYAIQCKCYSKTVGNKAVQEVSAAMNYYHANVGAVITNNYFTENAQRLANANGILLWDRTTVTDWLYQAL